MTTPTMLNFEISRSKPPRPPLIFSRLKVGKVYDP